MLRYVIVTSVSKRFYLISNFTCLRYMQIFVDNLTFILVSPRLYTYIWPMFIYDRGQVPNAHVRFPLRFFKGL